MKILLIILFISSVQAQEISREEIQQSQLDIQYSLNEPQYSPFALQDTASSRMQAYNDQKARERQQGTGVQNVGVIIPLLWYVED